MTGTPLAAVVRQVRRLAIRPAAEALSDQQLLHRYVVHHEEAAFAALVYRHAPLVLGVGRRVLHDWHAAEDVLQATFLLLARKAASIRNRDAVGSWLYGVAYRLAARARQRGAAHAAEISQETEAPRNDPLAEVTWRELRAVLDEELMRLPEAFQAPLLLCLMQGRTQDEAAAALGWSKGTLRRRFTRGRELLRRRLAARGVSLGVGLTASVLAQAASAAALSPALLRPVLNTARHTPGGAAGPVSAGAAALAEEGMRALPAARLHLSALGGLVLLVLAAGAGLLTLNWPAARQAPQAQAKAAGAVDAPDPGDAGPPRDLFGDPLPAGALARLGTVRFRQGNFVYGLLLSPDGKTVVSYGGNQAITFWDAATGREVRRFPKGARVAAFTPDGRTLISFGDYEARFWDAATGKVLRSKEVGRAGWMSCLAVSPDGKHLAACGPSEQIQGLGQIKVWDLATDRLVHTFTRQGREPTAVAFSPDGKLLAAGYRNDKAIRFWDLAQGKETRVLTGHSQGVRSLAFSRDGTRLASGGAEGDGSLRLWDLATGKQTALLTGIKGRERTSASSGKDGRLSNVRHEPTLGEVRSLAFSPDGSVLVSGGGEGDPEVRVFDVAAGKQVRQLGDRRNVADGLAFARDGRTLYAGMGGSVRLFEVATGKELGPVGGHGQFVSQVRLSPDGRVAATAGGDRTVRLWDVRSGKELKRLEGHEGGVRCVAFAPDGRLLASGGDDRTVRLWEVATGRQVRCLQGHDGDVYDLAFSPDGRLLASCDYFMGGLLLWEVGTGKLQKRLTEGVGLMSLAFAPDGRTLAAGEMAMKRSRDKEPNARIRFFDVTTGKETRSLNGHEYWVHGLAYSPDGKVLASAGRDQQVRLWEPGTGKLLGQLDGHRWGANCLTFTPDGRTLAVGAFDHPLDLWELASRQIRQRLVGHEAAVHSLAFTPDGRTLLSVSMDTTGLVWDVTGLRAGPRRPAAALSPKELQAAWADLADADAKAAHRALWSLVAAGEQAVPWLREHLRPAPLVPARRIAELVAELDNARFPVRDRAARELERLEETAGPALREALAAGPGAGKPSEEFRRRVEGLLKKLEEPLTSAERLRAVRAVEVLEQVATPAARQGLQTLAGGAPAARMTREAQAALRRLAGKAVGGP
jgi:RNA polymerase sigma factor (sigma-70 family)